MAPKCEYHRDRDAAEEIGGRAYCLECCRGQRDAARLVGSHAEPRDCFISYQGSGRWTPISGNAAAHWVAHQLGIEDPLRRHSCLLGFAVRLQEVLRNRRELSSATPVRVGDLWVSLEEDHCGLVAAVHRDRDQGIRISIRHASSQRRRVATDDFYEYFMGSGKFYRSWAGPARVGPKAVGQSEI